MHVERIELRYIQLPLKHPFETSFGRSFRRDTIVVRIWADGVEGWGESPVEDGPWYSYETVETAWHVQREFLVPMLLGQEVETATQVFDRLAGVRGHNMAKTGLEEALWDVEARQKGVSVAQLLGGTRERVASGVSIGIQDTPEELLERIEGFVKQGYRRVKIKIKPGWDVEIVRAVRRAFPDLPLMVDANSAYRLSDAEHLAALDEFDLMMIEQPLAYDDIYEHSLLQRRLRTPLCLDESIHTPAQARAALELGSCRIINIKPGRVGGLVQARRIHDLCLERGVPVWCGGLLEVGIGRAHNVAIASLPGYTLPGDISASDRYFERDVVDPPFTLNPDGTITVPTGLGLGVEVDLEFLEHVTVRRETFTPAGAGLTG
ncbi:MAG: o-succinylbenzoate synthase [Chloroflexota bacterium]|nr:MAG: o-succinylbenzoate synthase [Chloroflexota bacterium]